MAAKEEEKKERKIRRKERARSNKCFSRVNRMILLDAKISLFLEIPFTVVPP